MPALQIEMFVSRDKMEEQTKLSESLFSFWVCMFHCYFRVHVCIHSIYITFPCFLFIDWAYSNGLKCLKFSKI